MLAIDKLLLQQAHKNVKAALRCLNKLKTNSRDIAAADAAVRIALGALTIALPPDEK